ncbi:MAG TPA: DNA adenine methylase [Armatimonadota bacterium]
MRYIGSKNSLLGFIENVVAEQCPGSRSFVDLFSGTAVVGRRFKEWGFEVTSNDLLRFSYAIARAVIQNNSAPRFEGLPIGKCENPLAATIKRLNALPPELGFVTRHYAPGNGAERTYLTPENAGRIDAIRIAIEGWRASGLVTDDEFFVLLAALLDATPSVSNIAGTYGAYLKFWEPRSAKRLTLVPPPLLVSPGNHRALNVDANAVVGGLECDILYLDPPYNERQYATNYHLLETIARWDAPELRGVTGLPARPEARSRYCSRSEAAAALADVVCRAPAKHILLSYNSEGLVPHDAILAILEQRGRPLVFERDYRRFRSDADRPNRAYKANTVAERLYLVHT